MARKGPRISKTARASLVAKGKHTHLKTCPKCKKPMQPLKVMKFLNYKGGMYWVCEQDNLRLPMR